MMDLARELGKLDDHSRALLELSMCRGMEPEEIASTLQGEASEVEPRRGELLERLFEELGLETRDVPDELYATLPDLPPELWRGS